MPPGPNLEGYTPTPGRKIYDDASGVTDAYTSGLGNANVSPFLDIAQGLDKGIDLANKANKFLEDIGPTGAERRRLELETERARASTLQSQATIAAIKAKADALNEQAIITQEGLSYQQQINQLETSIQNGNLVKEGLSGIGQIQDAASLTAYISDPKFGPIGADPVWGANIRNKAALLMGGASSQDQISLIRAAEAASPGSGDKLKNLASADVQRQLADPREQAYLESARTKANAPAKVTPDEKIQAKIQTVSDGIIGQVSKLIGDRPVDTVETTFVPDTNSLEVVTKSGTKLGSVPIPQLGTGLDKAAREDTLHAMLNNGLGQLLNPSKATAAPPQQAGQPQAATNVAAAPTSLANPENKQGVGKLLATKDGNDLLEMRSKILGDSNYSAWDAQLTALKIAVQSSADGPRSSGTERLIERTVESMFKDVEGVNSRILASVKQAAIDYYHDLWAKQQKDEDDAKDLLLEKQYSDFKKYATNNGKTPTIADIKAAPKKSSTPTK